MKIGRRTQAYFIGFLIGLAIVSVLIDSRRDRSSESIEEVFTWERADASLDSLPDSFASTIGAQGYVTGVEQKDEDGNPTGLRGFFFADSSGKRYWWYGSEGAMKLFDGEKLTAISQPGLEWDLMKVGFEHQGHKLISRRALAPNYVMSIDVHSAIEMADAYENLLSKSNYVASVGWVEIELPTD